VLLARHARACPPVSHVPAALPSHHEPARAAGGRQSGMCRICERAVADPLRVPVSACIPRLSARSHGVAVVRRAEVAARLGPRWRHRPSGGPRARIRVSQRFFCSYLPPKNDRVAAEKGSQDPGSDAPEVDSPPISSQTVDIEGAPTHAFKLLGNEEELDAEVEPHIARTASAETRPGHQAQEVRPAEVSRRRTPGWQPKSFEAFLCPALCSCDQAFLSFVTLT